MRNHAIRLTLVSFFFTGACGSDPATDADTTGSDGVGSDTETTDTAGSDAVVADPVFASLLGEWHVPCAGVGGGYTGRSHLDVTATAIKNTFTSYFGDTTCSDESKKVVEVYVEDSAWVVGAPFGEGVELDMVLRKTTVEVFDEALKAIWDRDSGCGPFTVGEVKDVSGMSCYGYWRPKAGETYYTIISVQPDTFLFGAPASGDMKTEATRSTALDHVGIWQRVGSQAPSGFIEGTIKGSTYRAEENAAAREVQNGHIQIGATTKAITPWETWVVNVPNAVGTYDCTDDSINAYINFGYTEGNLPVLWDTEQDGGDGCIISVSKAAPAVGDTIEGSFSGTLGDGNGSGHAASDGSFSIVRVQ